MKAITAGARPATSVDRVLVTRALWSCVTLLVVALYVVGTPVAFTHLHQSCVTHPCSDWQLTSLGMRQLHSAGLSLDQYAASIVGIDLLSALVWLAVSAAIIWRAPVDRMAFVAAVFLVLFRASTYGGVLATLRVAEPEWLWPVRIIELLGQVSLIPFFCLFPDGRFVPRWTRWAVIPAMAAMIPSFMWFSKVWPIMPWTSLVLMATLVVCYGGLIAVQVYRYRRVSGPVQRQQTKWVVLGVAVALAGTVSMIHLTPDPTAPPLRPVTGMLVDAGFGASLLLIPLSIGISILRYRLWDIDLVINRTLVYGALTGSVIALYILVVGGLGQLLQARGNFLISLLGAGLVAVLFQPLRLQLQRGVNRLMYGERDDPYGVVSRLGQRLDDTLSPEAVLPTIVETVAQALKLPYVAIALPAGDRFHSVAATGVPSADLVTLSLLFQGEPVGRLLLAPRLGEAGFSPADRRLLGDLARQAGIACHGVLLTADLRRSREQLVTTREEERRRLRRDLHDGLGPALASLTLKLDAARNLLRTDSEATDSLLCELKGQVQGAIADIRRLVYGLRPPTLDELGLVYAIREQARHYETSSLHISVEAPEPLPPLPAAVEVAAYRIVQEALTNVVRHAHARVCTVRLEVGDSLSLEVTDDGCGLNGAQTGVGLSSMRERAEELGGTCVVESCTPAGMHVLARLPLSRMATGEQR